ncbi:MAG: methyltransferase domain-containing protein [Cyanobacteria bacterium]|jgi:2-polyprenyl-3-methyl-5-hydroxy-6-metoxy-1,4-benzoquinol methylase|nr:methyltransferase domain-containing protein [Cyanobacteria bacterium GSL.Bin1]
MTTQSLDSNFNSSQAEAFAEKLLNRLNSGGLALMISIGHRTHLFDTMAELPPTTSSQIAQAANLQERYVREWLKAMTVGGIIEYDPKTFHYYLPAEHAAFLTRTAESDNMATFFQHIAELGTVEDAIVNCFQVGGGVPYSAFSRFHTIIAEDSGQTIVSALEEQILPLVPGLVERLQSGIDVMDLGYGSGRALNKLAQLFPASRFIGYDFSESAIATANQQAQTDTATLDEVECYDLITTFDAIHDQVYPDVVLQNIYRTLRSDGVYLMQDIRASSDVSGNLDHPFAPFLYTVSCMHCMTVS